MEDAREIFLAGVASVRAASLLAPVLTVGANSVSFFFLSVLSFYHPPPHDPSLFSPQLQNDTLHIIPPSISTTTTTHTSPQPPLLLPVHRNVYVCAFGKAVMDMVGVVVGVLGEHLVQGIASIPIGTRRRRRRRMRRISGGG